MKLKKTLDLKDVFCISSGAMISSGIFVLPGIAFAEVGPAVFVSYLLAGIMALLGITAVIELSTAMPKAGGDYYFIGCSMGPFPGTVSGLLSWSAITFKSAFAVLGMAEVLRVLWGVPVILSAVVLTLVFVAVNVVGVKKAAKLEVFLVFALIVLMTLYIVLGLPRVEVGHFKPFVFEDKSLFSIIAVSGMVFVSFGGLLKVSSISEEVVNPKRNIPFGIIISVIAVTVLYTLIIIVTVGMLEADTLKGNMTPIADVADVMYGNPGFVLLTVAALFAFITTANAGIMAASRYPLALSRDKMIPAFLSKVNARFRTPTAAIYLTGGFMIAVQFFDLETLVKTASAVILASYVLSNLSVIILRESHIRNYRPTFRAPLYPWLQIFSIVAFSIMIFSMGLKTLVTISIIPVALVFYMIYGRLATKEFALMHLIERITNKKLTQHSLENELREIIRQRDDIVKDEFDMLVENAPVMMVDKTVDISELFKQVAHVLSDDISADEQEIFKLLYDREDESSTAISSDVAVPHIIIEGERIFHLLLIKSAEGIYFSEYSPKVKAIFLLVGTRDLRNQHLKTLAAVAQVIQDRRFSECWDLAENKQQVRDVVLLAKRQRSTSFRD